MKVIILLAGFGTRMRPHTWSRPKPLLKVAGNTVVGHLLDLMRDVTTEEVIFVVGYKGEQIEAWIRQNYPHLKTHFVTQADPRGQAHAVWLCRDYLQEDHDVVVAFGDGIIDADYAHFAADHADGVLLVQEVDDPRRFGIAMRDENGYVTRCVEKPVTTDQKMAIVGINWFRSGRQLLGALETVLQNENPFKGEYWMVDAYNVMLEQGARFVTRPVLEWEDAGTPEAILRTNARLLSVGYASQNALERSYQEGFTVVPPVYIHPSAEIEAAVIGPYASVDAGVCIKNAVVRNSIVDHGAYLADCVLDGSLVGEDTKVTGRGKALFVGDNSIVDIG